MRILSLRFKNLNSLVGEWAIDFNDPAFTADGIFAITGPTGAGKSTLLDALCLALYGSTPRLGRITASGNEIMSRQTGECFAEVSFVSAHGHYCCHWAQHRARKKPDGELQAPRHEIVDADTDQVLENKLSTVTQKLEAVTGMDFQRFTRSMLLAQGHFARFLQANADERAPILEQITGTEIYSEISKAVHERHRSESSILNSLHHEMAAIGLLDPEQEAALDAAIQEHQASEFVLNGDCTALKESIDWLNTVARLRKDLDDLKTDAQKLKTDRQAFAPEAKRLEQALAAAPLEADYARLLSSREQQAKLERQLNELHQAMPALEKHRQAAAQALANAETHTAGAQENLRKAWPLLTQVRALDTQLRDRDTGVQRAEIACQSTREQLAKLQALKSREAEQCDRIEANIAKADQYLSEHRIDESLIGGLSGIEEQLRALERQQIECANTEKHQLGLLKDLQQATKHHDEAQQRRDSAQQALQRAAQAHQQAQIDLKQLLGDRALADYRREKEGLLREMALLSRIADLEAQRGLLEQGKPCPLCGATEHPFAEVGVPVANETEEKIQSLERVITAVEDQQGLLRQHDEAERAAQQAVSKAETALVSAAQQQAVLEQHLQQCDMQLLQRQKDLSAQHDRAAAILAPFDKPLELGADPTALIEELQGRCRGWQKAQQQRNELLQGRVNHQRELARLDALWQSQQDSLKQKQMEYESLIKDRDTLGTQRRDLFGEQSPEAYEKQLQQAVSIAESAEKKARELYGEQQQQWQQSQSRLAEFHRDIETFAPRLLEQETGFSQLLASKAFASEVDFLRARLAPEQRDLLVAQARSLEQRQTELNTRRAERQSRLEEQMAKPKTAQSLSELEPEYQRLERGLLEVRETLARLRVQWENNTNAKSQRADKQAQIEAQQKEYLRWHTLHELIGSADGKKYRNFAQGLTFEVMIGHANRQLMKMTDRYLLTRSEQAPLELNVVDNYQAGEIRSTKNLSGGESFIVSLALALGLSQMASSRVRVDSLFLDEGFGTLDEDALDVALETLANLQQDGKLIGVISHVAMLKERISTRIQVTPLTGGRSRLSGPGCH
ncbi:exonuclease SbcC [Ectothiorhodosinus mongolicus]|uniref:Exonuclease SbcC n=1 Tax=Ectothiorhodosinus mongolicus TaxID=233100 RepID=A0A1R3W5G5_9GAMM|nr:AAA family ATPase [Ectothiorhodosinus mongolicus]ULX57599.1 chromosome segregation protein SMC [Ectothiorhodosinus mongolicus]SIT73028.1 exonuclease SbcC [Ectothiorhodosinus mongolicus]